MSAEFDNDWSPHGYGGTVPPGGDDPCDHGKAVTEMMLKRESCIQRQVALHYAIILMTQGKPDQNYTVQQVMTCAEAFYDFLKEVTGV